MINFSVQFVSAVPLTPVAEETWPVEYIAFWMWFARRKLAINFNFLVLFKKHILSGCEILRNGIFD